MKLIKLFGLALVAALATMALAGAGTAAAKNVELCKVNTSPCPNEPGNEQQYKVGQVIEAQGGGGKLKAKTFFGTEEVQCEKAHIKGAITAQNKEQQVKGTIEKVEWLECFLLSNQVKTAIKCKVTALQLPWTAHIEQGTTQDGNGIMWVGPQEPEKEHGQPGAKVECEGKPTAVVKVKETQPPDQKPLPEEGSKEYEKEKWIQMAVTGGATPTIAVNQIPLKSETFGVTEGFWSETFTVTSPTPIWVEQRE